MTQSSWAEWLEGSCIVGHSELASQWHTCAVGEILKPQDPPCLQEWIEQHPKLKRLGQKFSTAVRHNLRAEARGLHEEIHKYLTPAMQVNYHEFERC